jgi:hypothetical protein
VARRDDQFGVALQRVGEPAHHERLAGAGRTPEQHALAGRKPQPDEIIRALREAERVALDQRQRGFGEHDVLAPHRRRLLDPEPGRRNIEVVVRRFEHERLAAPARATLGAPAQLGHHLRREARGTGIRSSRNLQSRPNAAIAFADVEQHGEGHPVTAAEPQSARRAPDGLGLADVHLLVLGRCGHDAIPGFGEVGQPEREIRIAQARAAEATVGQAGEERLQRTLQVRPHPVRKVPARDDQPVDR